MSPVTAAMISWIATMAALTTLLVVLARSWRRLRARVRAERVRSAFAEARNGLVVLALREELPTESATYRTLYFLNTAVMRRDDLYDEMWPSFLRSLSQVNDPKHVTPLRDEAKSWTPAVAEAALKTFNAMEVLLVEHSILLRGLFRLTGGLMPYLAAVHSTKRRDERLVAVREKIEVIESRHEPARRDVRRFQEVLLRPQGDGGPTSLQPC